VAAGLRDFDARTGAACGLAGEVAEALGFRVLGVTGVCFDKELIEK
jgi:hypothetical protein